MRIVRFTFLAIVLGTHAQAVVAQAPRIERVNSPAVTPVGRYSRLVDLPALAPLDAPLLRSFGTSRTVGDAVRLTLSETGYRLADAENTHPLQSALLTQSLPNVHRDLSGTSALGALVALGKPGYRVMVDHVHRLVGYEVRPSFADFGGVRRAVAMAAASRAVSTWQCLPNKSKWRCVAKVGP